MSYRIISLIVSFFLVFEQAGFAQVAPQFTVPAYLNGALAADSFRPVQLRSLSYDSVKNNFDLLLDKGDAKDLKPVQLQGAARQLLEFFTIGITLPNSAFWVNLRTDNAGQIIDPALERTDLGKILLEADLQLKKDLAACTSPATAEGKKYWSRLYEKAETLFGQEDVTIPTVTRPWIVPAEIIIRQTATSAYVYKAGLKVMLEQDYLKDSAKYAFSDPRLKQLNDYSTALIRELIVPKLTRAVNSAKRYASLRQAYYSLVLAQWFKEQFKGASSAYAARINTANLAGLTSKTAWSKDTYFNAYKQSFARGEYTMQETVRGRFGLTVRRYCSGGVVPVAADPRGIKTIFEGSRNPVPLGANQVTVSVSGDTGAAVQSQPGADDPDGGKNAQLEKPRKAAFEEELDKIWPQEYSGKKYSARTIPSRKEIGRFLIQYNPERINKSRPASDKERTSIPAPDKTTRFTANRDNRANRQFLKNQVVAGIPVEVFTQPIPLGKGHIIILPGESPEIDRVQPQILNAEAIKVALTLVENSLFGEHFKVGFNSWGAHGSVNHLHLQALFYENAQGQAAPLPIEQVALGKPERRLNSAALYFFKDNGYPVKGFVVEGDRVSDIIPLADSIIASIYARTDIPFNALFTQTEQGKMRVYVLPNESGIYNPASDFGTGVAFLEKAGEIVSIKKDDSDPQDVSKTFSNATEKDLFDELAKVSIDPAASTYKYYLQRDILERIDRIPAVPDGGLQSVDFLTDLLDIQDLASQRYLKLVRKFKGLLDVNDVNAIYDLEDTLRKWNAGEKDKLRDKYRELKRQAVYQSITANPNNPLNGLVAALEERQQKNLLSEKEVKETLVRVNDWLTRPYFPYLVAKLKDQVSKKEWETLTQQFYTVIDFGTAGKRGQQTEKNRASADVLPGTNMLNDYTVAEYSYALAQYQLANNLQDRGAVLSGDTRIKSALPRVHRGESEQAYTDLEAEILTKMGIQVYRYPQPRSIGQAAWTTVQLGAASMGYNSASHNLWHDNGVKASNEFGAQLFANERSGIMAYLEDVLPEDIAAVLAKAPVAGREKILTVDAVKLITGETVTDIDAKYIEASKSFVVDASLVRKFADKVVSFFSPVHGSGQYTIPAMLKGLRFPVRVSDMQKYQDIEFQFQTVAKPDPDYEAETGERTVDIVIREAEALEAKGTKVDFVFATDPDADRSVYVVKDNEGNWVKLKANDVWSLLTWYMARQMKAQNRLPANVIKTWVTTDLIKEIAGELGLNVAEPSVGFNKIGEVALKEIALPALARNHGLDEKVLSAMKPLSLEGLAQTMNLPREQLIQEINRILRENLLLGCEESNGFSPGGHILEKDGAVAAVIFHEVAAYAKFLDSVVKSGDYNQLDGQEIVAEVLDFARNNPGRELTVYNLLNMLYLKYGYYATQNQPFDFADSPQGRQEKESVLAHLKSLKDRLDTVQFGSRQVSRMMTGDEYINTHGTDIVFNEKGYRFELVSTDPQQKYPDYVTFRPSGTEAKIRIYVQVGVNKNELNWQNLEQKKREADAAAREIALAAQKSQQYALDERLIRANAAAGFSAPTTLYQAVFDSNQQQGFVQYFKGYRWPGKTIFAGLKTIVADLKVTDNAKQKGKKVIGNGLGVLSVLRQYSDNLAEGLQLAPGTYNLRELLSRPDAVAFLHNVIITSGGQAQRNAKYSQIGKCLAKIPMSDKDRQEARYILDGLMDIAINIEKNYQADEFMFGIIYGDALISFNPDKLAAALADAETRKGLACMLLNLDYTTAPDYGFAKVDSTRTRVEMFQEKYNKIKRDDQGNIVLKEEEKAINELGSDEQKSLLKQLIDTKDIALLDRIFPSDAERNALMKSWLQSKGYLTAAAKIYMNPAFSVMGIEAFLRSAFLAGVTDANGDILVGSDGKVIFQAQSYLSRALDGEMKDDKINIDYYGSIVPAFASQAAANDISQAINAKGKLYAVPFEGIWYDTGAIVGEREINTQERSTLEVAATFDLGRSVHSRASVAGQAAPNYGMDSWVETAAGSVDPKSVQADTFVKAGTVKLGRFAQLYNVLFKNMPSLEVREEYVLTLSTLAKDGKEYIVPVVWDQRDDFKKGYFGGRTDPGKADSAKLIATWAKSSGLAVENIIGDYAKKAEAIEAKPESERALAWRDGVDLYSAKLFPIISVESFNAWNEGKPIANSDEAKLINELPEILRFLQHLTDKAPDAYVQAVATGAVASRADTYTNQAPVALVALREDIANLVKQAFGDQKQPETTSNQNPPDDPGGIDFRALPVVGPSGIKPIPVTPAASVLISQASVSDLDKQWRQIQQQMAQGPMPYEQLKTYTAACCRRQDAAQQMRELQECIAAIVSLEEEAGVGTCAELKEVLATIG